MIRRREAHVSQTLISRQKTIYVEGNLDCKIIRDFLNHKDIDNVRVTEVSSEVINESLGAKHNVIEIIKKANQEGLPSEYMGIIDLDFDFFNNEKLTIPNLHYTDYNSIESYFLNKDLLNRLLDENNLEPLDTKVFEKWRSNSLILSSWFYFQTRQISVLTNEEKISFQKLRLDNEQFVNYKIDKINFDVIIKHKTQCVDKIALKKKYINFVKALDRKNIYENTDLFLHGKHTFKFFICLLHKRFKKLKGLSYENLEYILKDKFILFFANAEVLFKNIIIFAKKPTYIA